MALPFTSVLALAPRGVAAVSTSQISQPLWMLREVNPRAPHGSLTPSADAKFVQVAALCVQRGGEILTQIVEGLDTD